jgi:hypothetical protein
MVDGFAIGVIGNFRCVSGAHVQSAVRADNRPGLGRRRSGRCWGRTGSGRRRWGRAWFCTVGRGDRLRSSAYSEFCACTAQWPAGGIEPSQGMLLCLRLARRSVCGCSGCPRTLLRICSPTAQNRTGQQQPQESLFISAHFLISFLVRFCTATCVTARRTESRNSVQRGTTSYCAQINRIKTSEFSR